MLTLTSGDLTLELAPDIGGSIARFFSQRDGHDVHWLRPAPTNAREPLEMASFPLVPFCGRIRDGRFKFKGLTVTLPPNFGDSPHPVHGDGWHRRWTVATHTQTSATLTFVHHRADWPFAYRARQMFQLTGRKLTVELTVTNTDSRPMPLGLGQHPYFPMTPDTTIKARVAQMWETDAELLPLKVVRNDTVTQLEHGLQLSTVTLDNNFVGWQHEATVRWPERGDALRVSADQSLSGLVLYTHPSHTSFCVEPVGNCADWLNLTNLDPAVTGGSVIAPGETLSATIHFEPQPG